jgi:predicted exporter
MKTTRAIATGLLVAIVAFLLLVWVPNKLLQQSGSRSSLVLYATVEFTVALVALLWALRRLQRRKWL